MSLGRRIANVLQVTGLTPRDLSAVCKIHWTTIYALINDGGEGCRPITSLTLHKLAEDLETLHGQGKLPFADKLDAKTRQHRLTTLLNT